MKVSSSNFIALVIAFFALVQNASAQWSTNTAPNPDVIHPTNLANSVGIGTNVAGTNNKLRIVGGNLQLDYASGVNTGNLFFGGITAPNPGTPANGMRLFFNNPAANRNGYIDVRTIGSTTANDGLLFRVDGANGTMERMRIVANTGNVGIGISNPKQKLHVAGGMMLSGPTLGFGGPMVLFSESAAANPVSRWGIEYVRAATPDESGMNFWIPWDASNTAPGNHHLFLRDKDGKVGVGIDPNPALYPNAPNGPFPPGYRLYVKEGLITERLMIADITTSAWADYVFAPDYKLKPLSEVEAFVKANKHLPNVPSAQDIEKDGLDVADMLARQMEKIEELMLHSIELNKRVEKLEAENAALKQVPATTVNH